jgi:hypothetical protein
MQANKNKRALSPARDRTSSPVRDSRKRDEERSRRDASSPVHSKRRREDRDEGERERDNRPRYYQPSNPNIPKGIYYTHKTYFAK